MTTETEIIYDFWCNRCDGDGKCYDHVYKDGEIVDGAVIECPKCGGTGYARTNEGRNLLEFLRRQKVIA